MAFVKKATVYFWKTFNGLFLMWQILNLLWQICYITRAYFHCGKWPNIETLFNHLVTLLLMIIESVSVVGVLRCVPLILFPFGNILDYLTHNSHAFVKDYSSVCYVMILCSEKNDTKAR